MKGFIGKTLQQILGYLLLKQVKTSVGSLEIFSGYKKTQN